jgi:uncharacterized membrane protein YhaH (DUF805 family)
MIEADSRSGLALTPVDRVFGFSGRLGGVSYWLIAALLAGVLLGIKSASNADTAVVRGLSYFLFIPFAWCAFAIVSKRLHDLNYSGAWALLLPVPYVGFLVAIVVGLVPGTRGANRFGPRRDSMLHPAADVVA